MEATTGAEPKVSLTSRLRHYLPAAVAVLASVAITVLLVVFQDRIARLGAWGYPGAFVVMVLNNATIFFPALGHAFIIGASQTLNPWLLGVVGGVGGTIGELTGYIVGHTGGRAALSSSGLYQKYQRLPGLRGNFVGPTLFVFAAAPLPFDVAGIVAGATRYPVLRFLFWVGMGKIIKTVIIAVVGSYALDWLFGLFG